MKIEVEDLIQEITQEIAIQQAKIDSLEWARDKFEAMVNDDTVMTLLPDDNNEDEDEDEDTLPKRRRTLVQRKADKEKADKGKTVEEFFDEKPAKKLSQGRLSQQQKIDIGDAWDQGSSLDDICTKFERSEAAITKYLKSQGRDPNASGE